MPVPVALAVAASVATVVGGISSVVGFFSERNENRRIIGSIDEIKRYLIDIDKKIDVLKLQNDEILSKLDSLPEDIKNIVESIVSVALLDERYSALVSIRTNYLELDDAARERYRINTVGWDEISRSLTYLVLHENRVRNLFDLLKWFEFALVASEMRGAPVISSLVETKGSYIIPLQEELSDKLNEAFFALEKILNSRFVRSHNLHSGLTSMDELRFELADRKLEQRTRYGLDCPPGVTIVNGGCREVEFLEDVPENIAFNTRLDGFPAEIKVAAEEFQQWASYYAEVRDMIKTLNRYTEIIEEDRASDEVRALEARVVPMEDVSSDTLQFVRLEPIDA